MTMLPLVENKVTLISLHNDCPNVWQVIGLSHVRLWTAERISVG